MASTLHAPFALAGAVLAACSLVGWVSGASVLTSLLPGRPSLSPMTALLLLLGAVAVSVLPRRRGLALRLAALEALAGFAIVLAQLSHVPDRLGVPVEWWSSALTGAAFVLSGASSMLLATGRLAGGQILASLVLLFAALLGLGHVFPRADLYSLLPGTGVAIPTVVAFSALSIGQLLSFSRTGVFAALTSRNVAAKVGLRLLLTGGAGALLLTAALVVAQQRGWFDAVSAVLLLAWFAIALLGATLWSLAVAVDRAELARTAAEDERNQMRHLVVAAITHDLRSPLQAAMLAGQLLERLAAEPQAAEAVARLQRSHRRLDRLLQSLLDSLAVGAGQPLSLRPSAFALDDLVREVVAENQSLLAHRVRLEGAAKGCWDRDALFRVLENLLLNALKYGEPATPIACRIGTAGDQVVAEVENRGPPIPPGEWESIFQPFVRRDAVRDAGPVGWGVGLAYARSVATSHGGSVQVAASGAEGTVFELRLPSDSRAWLGRSRVQG